jgi:hypothetical protein
MGHRQRNHIDGHVYGGVGVEVRPAKKTPIISVVPCTDCEAQLGQPCKSIYGKILSSSHVSRRRMALRKQRDA